MSAHQVSIKDLIGETLVSVENINDEIIRFVTADGLTYEMWHQQSCCESVGVESIVGDLDDLVGSPILMAEEVNSEHEIDEETIHYESYTWTFYKLATIKGYVDIRWFGSSNGYYSESVDFDLMKDKRLT